MGVKFSKSKRKKFPDNLPNGWSVPPPGWGGWPPPQQGQFPPFPQQQQSLPYPGFGQQSQQPFMPTNPWGAHPQTQPSQKRKKRKRSGRDRERGETYPGGYAAQPATIPQAVSGFGHSGIGSQMGASQPRVVPGHHPNAHAQNHNHLSVPNAAAVAPSPLMNPLPEPPRDVYESSPFKTLLNLPQTTALLTASMSADLHRAPSTEKKKKSGGLFRRLSGKSKKEDTHTATHSRPNVQFVPVVVNPPGQQHQRHTSMSQPNATPLAAIPQHHMNHDPLMPQAQSEPLVGVLEFTPDPTGPYSCFLNHSPHRILFRNKIYPSATHLFEALKFIDAPGTPVILHSGVMHGGSGRPELANTIAATPLQSLYPLVASDQFAAAVRTDWGNVFLSAMEMVLTLKFSQHANLRNLLLETRPRMIVYNDLQDEFWGIGQGSGENQMGKALVRVREGLYNQDHNG